jgi:hypothetical protein
MSVTRRRFFRQTLAAGPIAMTFWIETDSALAQGVECTLPNPGPAQPFVPNEPKIQTRFSAREMADPSRATQLQQFRDAIGLVRNLPAADVIGWTKQIAQHCINCAPADNNNIHYNWQFLPWHRGLLYFLERIMRKLSNHDDLRMVYWDWENTSSRNLPAIYAPSGQPLFWANRKVTGPPNWPLPNAQVDVQPLLAVPTFNVFGGTATQRHPVPASFSGPHANVHNAFAPGDMANLQFSPRDPVFYAHHGNIDRLWSSWVKAGHANPDFGNSQVFFYDENRKWRSTKFNDLRDESKLGYRYSSYMQATHPANTLHQFQLLGRESRFTLPTERVTALRSNAEGPRYLIIENIQNLEKLPAETLRYGIFADKPTVGTNSETDRGFLGAASRVFSSGHNHIAPLSAALNVTGKMANLASANQGAFDLIVAPLDASGKTTGPGIPLVADNVSLVE